VLFCSTQHPGVLLSHPALAQKKQTHIAPVADQVLQQSNATWTIANHGQGPRDAPPSTLLFFLSCKSPLKLQFTRFAMIQDLINLLKQKEEGNQSTRN
jgi:hypothetical protein